MRNILTRIATAVLALVVLCSSLLMTGCSTPKVAMTVDGEDYTTGQYLAYLYNTFYGVYMDSSSTGMPLYYYEMYNTDTDVWAGPYTYENQSYDLAGYISALAQDSVVRQVAVKRMMAEHGITLKANRPDAYAALQEEIAGLKKDAFIELGFNNESYAKMLEECNYNEAALFYGLYGAGGKRAIAETEIRTYFEENYISYMIVSTALQDSDGNDLTDEKKAEVKKQFEDYLALYEKDKDFDAVIHKFEEDEKAKQEAEENDTTTTTTGGTTAEGATTTTTEATTTTTTTAATTTTTEAPSTTGGETTTTTTGDGHDHEEEEEEHNHRVDVDAAADDEESELEKAIKAMAFDEVKIIEYKDDSDIPTMALVLKMDPEADRGEDEDGNPVDYYEDVKEDIIYTKKYEEFNDEVTAKMATLSVKINDKAVKACDPYEFRKAFFGE